jgi:hypothetical protein
MNEFFKSLERNFAALLERLLTEDQIDYRCADVIARFAIRDDGQSQLR